MKAGPFSRALGLSETTIRNYTDRNSKPSSDVLEKIYSTFKQVNLVWLVTGEGDPLLPGAQIPTEPYIPYQKNNHDSPLAVLLPNNPAAGRDAIADCEKERDGYRAERDSLAREVVLLREQLTTKDQLIAAKEEMLALLRGRFHQPNQ